MATGLVLASSSKLRYMIGALMYFGQGIPQGLLAIAIPAWLASEGVGAGTIGSYMAVIVLPWAFKLITGPFMDRFQLPSMGRRRPWVLAAQFGLSVSLLALLFVSDPVEQMGLLMLVGVLIMSFAATQDVAVDGMAIDLTPVNEQGRLNAFMSFGKAVGWSTTAAATGFLLVNFGLGITAVFAASVSALVLVIFFFVLERKSERRFPWGKSSGTPAKRADTSFRDVFSGINEVLWTPASLIIMSIMFCDGLVSGYGHALMPVAAVNVFGYDAAEWSQLVAIMGLVGAALTLGIGPLIDKFGAKRTLVLTAALVGVHAFMLAQTQYLWEDTVYVRVMLSLWVMMVPIVMVSVIALAMAVCSSKCSATQFAIYMSTANLGHSAGSKVFGMISDHSTYDESYQVMAMLAVAMVIILFFHRQQEETGRDKARKAAAKYTLAVAGGGPGMFWSGAMRCPKCRSDMETITHEGVEIDRCIGCHGLWFDVGEVESLRDSNLASSIDTGSVREGKHYNVIDEYFCPRCGGEMNRVVDPKQTHIWFETCDDCSGSFFDAGEFRDLAEVTISDYFKDLLTPKRSA